MPDGSAPAARLSAFEQLAAASVAPASSSLETALDLARRGFRVFPLARRDDGRVLPAVPWRDMASSDEAEVRRMFVCPVTEWPRDYDGVGISTGEQPDGQCIAAVDLDNKNGKNGSDQWAALELIHSAAPATLTIRTKSGGYHRFYCVDEAFGNAAKALPDGIDIRCEGGYVRAYGDPPDYGAPIAKAPEWLLSLLRESKRITPPATQGSAVLDTPWAIAAETDWLVNSAPGAIENANGDDTTFQVACHVRDAGISESMCLELMLEHWNEQKASPPWMPDELAVKVANAYRYGQNAIGSRSAEADFGPIEQPAAGEETRPSESGAKGKHRIAWVHPKDIKLDIGKRPLIKGLIQHDTFNAAYGRSNVGKTFVMLDMAAHVAMGWDWCGLKVDRGAVVYVATEGRHGIQRRFIAWCREHGVDQADIPLAIVPCPVNLMDGDDVDELVRVIREAGEAFGRPVVLTVIDTLARAMGSGDESTAKDMGQYVRNLEAVRHRTGTTTLSIHHTGKDEAKGMRGSYALFAAVDTDLEIKEGRISAPKLREFDKSRAAFRFKLRQVHLGVDEDGDPVTTCVVDFEGPEADFAADRFADVKPPSVRPALTILDQLIQETGAAAPSGVSVPPDFLVVSEDDWREACRGKLSATSPDFDRKTFKKACQVLSEDGYGGSDRGFVWLRP